MARPSTTADLKPDAFLSDIGTIDASRFMLDPDLAKAYATLLVALDKAGGDVHSHYGGTHVQVRLPATERDLEANLRRAQREWDELAGIYDVCDATHSEPESFRKDDLLKWIEAEGKDIPWEREHSPFAT